MPNRNRTAGHDAERDLAAYLRGQGWPDAATTRAVLGHDGTRQPGDIANVPGVCLDVKFRRSLEIGAALDKVTTDAPVGHIPFVIVKPYRTGDPGDWWAIARLAKVIELWRGLTNGSDMR